MNAMTRDQLLRNAKSQVAEVDVETLQNLLAGSGAPVLLDVREQDEVEQGQIPGARHVPRGFLEMKVEDMIPDRASSVAIYCAGGNRSALAALTLKQMG